MEWDESSFAEALKELSAGAEGPVDVADHGPGPEFRNLSSADVADHGPQLTAAELKVADALVDSLRAKGTNKISYEEIEKALLKAEAEERGETEKDKSPEHHRLHNWNSRTPESADYCDDKTMTALRATQVLWANDHPDTKLLLERKFPTSRRDALKIKWSQFTKSERLMTPEYTAAINKVLQGFPEPTKRTLNYLYLNYLSPYQQLIQAQGRHLFVMKCYHGRDESHCWFIPAAEVVAMHAATSEHLKQGISYNDINMVQTYSVLSVLAVHAEVWVQRPGQSAQSFGDCDWIGGMAFHYAMGDEVSKASQEFAELPTDAREGRAAKIAKKKDKKERQKANKKARAAEEAEKKKEEEEEERRKEAEELAKVKAARIKPTGLAGADFSAMFAKKAAVNTG